MKTFFRWLWIGILVAGVLAVPVMAVVSMTTWVQVVAFVGAVVFFVWVGNIHERRAEAISERKLEKLEEAQVKAEEEK